MNVQKATVLPEMQIKRAGKQQFCTIYMCMCVCGHAVCMSQALVSNGYEMVDEAVRTVLLVSDVRLP